MTAPLALIIEDDPNQGIIFQRSLQSAGFETALDQDGDRYNAILSASPVALVLLDLHLPAASGEEILSDLRSRHSAIDLPVWIVTADLYLAKMLTAKGETVLIKPISPARLIAMAAKVLSGGEGLSK